MRWTHWIIVLALAALSYTGYYLYSPRSLQALPGTGFLSPHMAFIHEMAAYVFVGAVLVRLGWAFVGNQYAQWPALVPITRGQWSRLASMARYYLLLQRKPPRELGHNPLSSLTYVVIYALFIVQSVTGFGLLAGFSGSGVWLALFGWVNSWLGVGAVQVVHLLLMFIFWSFALLHIYCSVIIELEERNGILMSIVTGYKAVSSPDEAGSPHIH